MTLSSIRSARCSTQGLRQDIGSRSDNEKQLDELGMSSVSLDGCRHLRERRERDAVRLHCMVESDEGLLDERQHGETIACVWMDSAIGARSRVVEAKPI